MAEETMAELTTDSTLSADAKEFALLAEFPNPETLMHACAKVRDAGFTRWDAHTPFPIHGLDKAMGLKRSMVSAFVLVMGLGGAALGMLLQYWTSAMAYPVIISGKPLFSWPAFVPIMFECGVLGGASGAVLGMLILGGLPRHNHPLFNSETFERVTDDAFFISIEAQDPKYDRDTTQAFLDEIGAEAIERVADE